MKNRCRINYIFLLLSFGIVSTILSTPISGQTQNNSQNQTPETGYTSGKPDIESANELEAITNDTQTSTSNDTNTMMKGLGEETQAGNQTAGGQQGNQTAGGQQGNQTAGGQQGNQTAGGQQGNQTAGGQQGNQSEDILSKAGKALGDLFK
jgi:TolA-binding protein